MSFNETVISYKYNCHTLYTRCESVIFYYLLYNIIEKELNINDINNTSNNSLIGNNSSFNSIKT